MRSTTQNLIRNLLASAWIARWIVLSIFVVCFTFFGSLHYFNATYVARGTLMVQKAQNSTIQEISAGLGRMAADEGGPFSKDLYTEKFLLYLNSRDFFLEAAEDLLKDQRINDVRTFLRITEEDMKNDSRYLPSESAESREKILINTLASVLGGVSGITKSGNISLEISATAANPGIAIILAENLMRSSAQYILSRELKELNAAKKYLQDTMQSIEQDLTAVFEQQVEEIRKNPKIQQASKKVLLEKIAKISGEIDILKTEIRGNDLILAGLTAQDSAEREKIITGSNDIAARFKSTIDTLREHIEALKKKRESYLRAGMSPDSATLKNIDDDIASSATSLKEFGNANVDTNPAVVPGIPLTEQIRIIEAENFVRHQKLKSLQKMLTDVFSEGIELATIEQQNENLMKRAEIRYSLFSDLSKQLFKVEMYRISFQNKLIEIETPSYRTISRKPTQFTSIVLALMASIGLTYLCLLHKEVSDPVVKSLDDLREVPAKLIGTIPPIRFLFRAPGKAGSSMIDHFIDNSDSIVFKNIRAKFIKHHIDSKSASTVCLITSSRPSEGKSFFSLNISASLANAGFKVVIIDTDSRKQGLSAFQESARTGIGLMEYLKGQAELPEVLQATDVEGVTLMPAGRFSHDTSELLLSQRMRDMIAQLREHFEFIVIDTAPVLAVNDGLSLMTHADLVTVMSRVNHTKKNDLIKTLESVADEGKIPQLVLNMSGSLSTYYYRKTGPSEQRGDTARRSSDSSRSRSDSAA